ISAGADHWLSQHCRTVLHSAAEHGSRHRRLEGAQSDASAFAFACQSHGVWHRALSRGPDRCGAAPVSLSREATAHIRARFPLTPVPGVPEIRVHKAAPTSGLWRLAEMEGDAFLEPYWASWWGGGVALARHVLDHAELVAGGRVLDLGCG